MRAKLFLILVISLVACNPAPSALPSSSSPVVGSFVPVGQPEIRDLGPSTETVWNCGSGGGTVVKHPSMSVATNWAVEWEVGGTAGTGVHIGDGVIPGGVDLSAGLEGHYANKFDQSIQQGTGWDLPAEPNTIVVYTLMWREVWQPGYVDVRLVDQSIVRVNVRYRTGIQSEIVSKQEQRCVNEQLPIIQPTVQMQPSPTNQASSTVYTISCDWAKDWQRQPDGSYLWVGQPPGTPACQNVGQAGELLQRLRSGENLTLVVDVGTTPLGLSICKGTFTAQTVVPGEYCVPNNPERWPRVTGRLVVTGSDGFMVGTGE